MKKLQLNIISIGILAIFLLLVLATSSPGKPMKAKLERTSNGIIVRNLDDFDYEYFELNIHPIDSVYNEVYFIYDSLTLNQGKQIEIPFGEFQLEEMSGRVIFDYEKNPNWNSNKVIIEVQLYGNDKKGHRRYAGGKLELK